MKSHLQNLECSKCGEIYDHLIPQNVCTSCGKPLLARYDLEQIAETWTPDTLQSRLPSLWRYSELLPISNRFVWTRGVIVSPRVTMSAGLVMGRSSE